MPGGAAPHRVQPITPHASYSQLGAADSLDRLASCSTELGILTRASENQERRHQKNHKGILEERWVNSIFNPVPKIPPAEDIWDQEKEEEIYKEQEKEENRIKAFLGVPKQDSVWGLMTWPRPSPEQARWWEDFSLPPLRGPCLCGCRLRAKMRLHPLPSLASRTSPSLATGEEPSWLRNQTLMEPLPASKLKIPKAVSRLPPKVCPKQSTVPKARRKQTPMSIWPPLINSPSKSSALKGKHTSSAKEVSHTQGAWDSPLPHLPSK